MDAVLDAIWQKLADMRTTYDARCLAPALLLEAAHVYAVLVAIGVQPKDDLANLFAAALKTARTPMAQTPRVVRQAGPTRIQ